MAVSTTLSGSLNSLTSNYVTDPFIGTTGVTTNSLSSIVSNNYEGSSNNITSLTSSLVNVSTDLSTTYNTDKRIKLIPKNMASVLGSSSSSNPLNSIISTGGMIFPYTPHITINGTANYNTQSPTHSNQDYKIYQNTPSQTFTISGQVSANSLYEAQYSASILHFLRVVTKSRSGSSTDLGLPPPVLYLNGYGTFMMNMLPVIVNSYSYDMPDTVDYVDVTIGSMTASVPTLTTVSVSVTVQNTPSKLNTFNMDQYAYGTMIMAGGWF